MAEEARPARRMVTPANVLTFSRLIFLPIVLFGVSRGYPWITVAAMFATWITDLLDGRIARLMKQGGTPFGKSLDSTVDFALIYCLFIGYYAARQLHSWQFAFLYLAMLTILTLQMTLGATGHEGETATTRLGKPTGAMQYAYLLFLAVLQIPAVGAHPVVQTVDLVYFLLMAALIVANSIECVMTITRLSRAPVGPEVPA